MKTEYISREAAIRFFNEWIDDLNKQIDDSVAYPHLKSDYKVCKTQLLDCIHAIEEMPFADVVDVVRCIDCVNWNGNDCLTMYGLFAAKPNNYCSRGVRRDPDGKTT